MKFGCSFGIFLNSANLICRSTDIWKYFIGSLRLRDNESRLYITSSEGHWAGGIGQSVARLTLVPKVLGLIQGGTTYVSTSDDSRKAVARY